MKQGENSFCYRVENSKAIRTPVSVGLRDGQWVEVIQIQFKPAKPGEDPDWRNPTGTEMVIEDAALATDGQMIAEKGSP